MKFFDGFQGKRRPGPCLQAWNGDGFDDYEFDQWRSAAERAAAALRAKGVVRGQPVGCLLTNFFPAYAGAIGIWRAGGAIVSLPTPARGMAIEIYLSQLREISKAMELRLLLAEENYAGLLREHGPEGVDVASFESLDAPGPAPDEPPGPDDLAFVQYSSGSTSNPRGCMLSARAIEAQIDLLAEAIDLDPERDWGVTWLPISHDMGFFGTLMLDWAKGLSGLLAPPERFLRSPQTWFEDCARTQATMTVAPNFALALAARTAKVAAPEPFPMRNCILGGERIEPSTIETALEILGPSGLDGSALTPAYGMAEAVLAVSVSPTGQAPRMLSVDRDALSEGRVEPVDEPAPSQAVQTLVSSGRPLPGVEVRTGGESEQGEILIRTPSLASGYGGDPETTAERFVDGELRTHDLGFVHEGEVYVQGRLDDVLVVGGRNISALDVEARVASSAPVRPGCCALVDVARDGKVALVILAEVADDAPEPRRTAAGIRDAAMSTAGIRVDECIILPGGTLPKTPSGKIQRFRCRELFDSGGVPPEAQTGL
ncbi:MAG: AMP-binding protein [Solirubrobacterales bacterium]